MTTEVSKVNQDLLQTINLVDNKLADLKTIETTSFKSHGQFRFNPAYTGNAAIDIHRCTSLEDLLAIYAYLADKEIAYNNAAEACEVDEYPQFKWINVPIQDWLHDIKLRVKIITHEVRKQNLVKAKSELSKFLSSEDKLAQVLESVTKLIR